MQEQAISQAAVEQALGWRRRARRRWDLPPGTLRVSAASRTPRFTCSVADPPPGRPTRLCTGTAATFALCRCALVSQVDRVRPIECLNSAPTARSPGWRRATWLHELGSLEAGALGRLRRRSCGVDDAEAGWTGADAPRGLWPRAGKLSANRGGAPARRCLPLLTPCTPLPAALQAQCGAGGAPLQVSSHNVALEPAERAGP